MMDPTVQKAIAEQRAAKAAPPKDPPATELEALEEVNESLFEIAGYLRSIKGILTFFLVLSILAILAQLFLR